MRPFGIALGPGGEIVVCDHKRGGVYVFKEDGSILQRISHHGDSHVSLHKPWGVAVDSRGRVFVADVEYMDPSQDSHGCLLMLGSV